MCFGAVGQRRVTMSFPMRYVPAVGCVLSLLTLVLTFSFSQTDDHKNFNNGNLTWPYISDTGKGRTTWPIFGTGMTLVALLLAIVVIHSYRCHKADLKGIEDMPGWLVPTSRCALGAGCLAPIGLSLLGEGGVREAMVLLVGIRVHVTNGFFFISCSVAAILNTKDFPWPHLYAAVWFFVFGIIWMTLETVIAWRLRHALVGIVPAVCALFA